MFRIACNLDRTMPILNQVQDDNGAANRRFEMSLLSEGPLHDAGKQRVPYRDVNRRLHETQRQLVRARSISMIGEMAAGAAHELDNPLAVISGRAQMVHADCADAAAAGGLDMIM